MRARPLLAALLGLASCTRGQAPAPPPQREAAPEAPFDWAAPAAALAFTADEAARRLGSFDFSAQVTWSMSRGTDRIRAVEKHAVRQLASGDFRSLVELDPGTWPGAETGREIVNAGGMTYARNRHAPFRERPTDRGRDARRFRDESFRLARDLAASLGADLAAAADGETTVLGRRARRFALSAAARKPPPRPARGAVDEDTRRRLDFLEGAAAAALEGEMLLDAEWGIPLTVKMRAALGQEGDPLLRAEVELEARITALGSAVGGVAAPRGALADERKPRGVARALDLAGLRKRAEGAPERDREDEDE